MAVLQRHGVRAAEGYVQLRLRHPGHHVEPNGGRNGDPIRVVSEGFTAASCVGIGFAASLYGTLDTASGDVTNPQPDVRCPGSDDGRRVRQDHWRTTEEPGDVRTASRLRLRWTAARHRGGQRGGRLPTTPGTRDVSGRTARTLVLGGVRSGKSRWAELALPQDGPVTYVATGYPSDDADWAERVAAHQARRPASWHTVESLDLTTLFGSADDDDALLVDDLGNWVARTLDATDGWNGDRSEYRRLADALVASWRESPRRIVLVSNDVGGGIHPESRAGRVFQDEMGRLNTACAEHADEVVFVIAGLPQWLKRTTSDGGHQ